MKFSLCIPMYNEEQIIRQTARDVSDYMRRTFDDYEIIFCDDGSSDGSADAVRSLGLENVRVIDYQPNRGKGYAVRTAMLAACGDVRMFTDADLAYGLDVIGRVRDIFEQDSGTDVLVGSRNISRDGYDGYTFIRRIASKVYIKVLCIVGGLKLTDSQCGCKAFSADAAQRIFSRCEVDRFAFDFECILLAESMGMCVREMPVRVINHRESKVHVIKDSFRMMRDLRKMRKRIEGKRG